MGALLALWRGELPLGEAFFTWALLGGLLVNVLTSIGFLWLIMAGLTLPAYIVGYGMSLPYNLVAAVGVFRSAGRDDADPRWAGTARVATIIGMILLSMT